MSQGAKKALRTAASIVLLRQRKTPTVGVEDYEVLMLERSNKKGAFQGTVVFPGGVVDPGDQSSQLATLLDVPELSRRQMLKLGAVRELFEETGVLLSTPAVDLSREQARTLRGRVHADGNEMLRVYKELGVKPDLESLRFFHHWVTPETAPARFDTHFFLAVTQTGKGAEADGGESVRVAWRPPSRFLDLFQRQEISYLPPQFYILSTLAGTERLEDVAKMGAELKEDLVHPWQPRQVKTDNGVAMCYPGDAEYPTKFAQSPLVPSVTPASRHRLHFVPVEKKEGGAGGRGVHFANGGVVTYELERNVPVPFGGESWASSRRNAATSKL